MYVDEKQKFVEPQATPACDPFSLEALIAWLETKSPEEEYCYTNYRSCLLGEYVRASGGHTDAYQYHIGGHSVPWRTIKYDGFPPMPMELYSIVQPLPQTFGAALERARSLQAREACGSKASI